MYSVCNTLVHNLEVCALAHIKTRIGPENLVCRVYLWEVEEVQCISPNSNLGISQQINHVFVDKVGYEWVSLVAYRFNSFIFRI